MRSTLRRGTATANVAESPRTLPATARHAMAPSVEPIVKGLPLRTRGSSSGSGGTAGCSGSPGGLRPSASPPSVGQEDHGVVGGQVAAALADELVEGLLRHGDLGTLQVLVDPGQRGRGA